MKVNSNRDVSAANPAARPPKANQPVTATPADFAASDKLAAKVAATPKARTAAVARAKALIADPNYPGPDTVKKIAQRLAANPGNLKGE